MEYLISPPAPERRPEPFAKRLRVVHPRNEATEDEKQRHAHRWRRVEESAGVRVARECSTVHPSLRRTIIAATKRKPVSAGTRVTFIEDLSQRLVGSAMGGGGITCDID
jgi:hypothetical protein